MSAPIRTITAALLSMSLLPVAIVRAQQLTPNAYAPSPTGTNVAIVADNYSRGDVALDPSLPVQDLHATINTASVGYARAFGFLDRYANFGFGLPYVHGDVNGLYLGQYQTVHRTGFGDPQLRMAVNLYGAPALTPRQFATYTPQTIVGLSLIVVAPLGQYYNTKLINIGSNRWSFKPEVGISNTSGPWTLEADVGGWFFTDNTDFAGGKVRSQEPIGALQLHATYTIKPHMWVAIDGTYYTGGRTTINGQQNYDLQKNSRVGVTFALPLGRQQSLKFAYSRGARTTIGGDFDTVGVSYQYVWFDR
jgi:Putative MetA-pathway of phenol degradation